MCQVSDRVAYRPHGAELISRELTDLCDCHDALLAVKCQLSSMAMICAVNLVAEGRLQKTILCISQVIKSRHRLLVNLYKEGQSGCTMASNTGALLLCKT